MAISNLSSQYISQSFQSLVQIDTTNGKIYDGLGAQITTLTTTASAVSKLNQNVLVSGSLVITGSMIVSGSQTFLGTKTISGSVNISGSKVITGNNTVIGTNTITGSLFVSGAQNFIGTKTLTGSIFITGSKFIVGDNYITGSHNVSGSITLTGPSIQNSAPLVSTLISGSMEFDGTTFYRTVDSNGRSLNANHHFFYLPTNTSYTLTTGDVFSGSLHAYNMLPASVYEVQYNVFYTKVTTGITTWTLNGTQVWQLANVQVERTALSGVGNAVGNVSAAATSPFFMSAFSTAATSVSLVNTTTGDTGGVYHKAIIKALIYTNSGTAGLLRLQYSCSAGYIQVLAGSYYTIKKMPASSVGIFTAP